MQCQECKEAEATVMIFRADRNVKIEVGEEPTYIHPGDKDTRRFLCGMCASYWINSTRGRYDMKSLKKKIR